MKDQELENWGSRSESIIVLREGKKNRDNSIKYNKKAEKLFSLGMG